MLVVRSAYAIRGCCFRSNMAQRRAPVSSSRRRRDSATIRYTCPGRGHGLTTITVESGTVVRLQTQGLFHGAPFDLDYEGRWQGRCA